MKLSHTCIGCLFFFHFVLQHLTSLSFCMWCTFNFTGKEKKNSLLWSQCSTFNRVGWNHFKNCETDPLKLFFTRFMEWNEFFFSFIWIHLTIHIRELYFFLEIRMKKHKLEQNLWFERKFITKPPRYSLHKKKNK